MEEMDKAGLLFIRTWMEKQEQLARKAELKLFAAYVNSINGMVMHYCKGAGSDDFQDAYIVALEAIRTVEPSEGVTLNSVFNIRIRRLFDHKRRDFQNSSDAIDGAEFLEDVVGPEEKE
jgi:hypothetical protein